MSEIFANINPFNLIVEFHELSNYYIVTSFESGKRRVLAIGFPTEHEAEVWIEEQQLLYILPDTASN